MANLFGPQHLRWRSYKLLFELKETLHFVSWSTLGQIVFHTTSLVIQSPSGQRLSPAAGMTWNTSLHWDLDFLFKSDLKCTQSQHNPEIHSSDCDWGRSCSSSHGLMFFCNFLDEFLRCFLGFRWLSKRMFECSAVFKPKFRAISCISFSDHRLLVLLSQVRGNALLLIVTLGIGGSFHLGFHATVLSSPTPVRRPTFISLPLRWGGTSHTLEWTCSFLSFCLSTVHKELHQQHLVPQIRRSSAPTDHHHNLVPDGVSVLCGWDVWRHER